MQFFRSIPAQSQMSSVLTIGNFDGVHQGHRALLRRLTEKARQVALPATVLSFEPHPREFFAPDQAPARLSSLREKLTLLEECGVDQFYVCRFNQKLADLTATSFIEQVLVRGLSVRHILIGDDFRFGRARMGDFSLLQQAGEQHRFTVEAMDTLSVDDIRASSSAVRRALAAGDLVLATRLLGRPYAIAGKVMHGQKLGRTLGFPTANLALKHKTLPFSGVFAVTVSGIGPENILGAASLGVRPTVADGLKPVLEVHLLDFDGDIYGRHVSVNFLHKLRDEEKYTSLELLTAQIERDVAAVRDFFRSTATA